MDFDDIIKLLVPKSTRKKLKKELKKMGLGDILKALFKTLFGGDRQKSAPNEEARRAKTAVSHSQSSHKIPALRSGSFMSQNSNYEQLSTEINEEVLALGDCLETLDKLRAPTYETA